jgi:hypothetical protein
MTKFKRKSSDPYQLITPSTPLAELEFFLEKNIFALSYATFSSIVFLITDMNSFVVTDADRKFVLAVATTQDLQVRSSFSFAFFQHPDLTPLFPTEFRLSARFLGSRLISTHFFGSH